jgi:sugar lactone lactonase YvrE
MRIRRLMSLGLVVLGVLGVWLVMSVSSALGLAFARQLAEVPAGALVSGPFSSPHGLAVGGAGHLFVTDAGNKVVDEFSSSGVFVSPQISGAEIPEGEFGSVRCVAVNASGDVYVSDFFNGVVDEFEPPLVPASEPWKLIAQINEVPASSGAPVTGTFASARCVAVNGSGDVYVLDQGNKVVDEFGPAGEFILQISGAETPEGEFGVAQGVAAGPEGSIYVADSLNHVIDKFESSGKLVAQIHEVPASSGATVTGPLGKPWAVAVDSKGNVYVADNGSKVVDEFTSAGVFLTQLTGIPVGEAPVSGPFGSLEGITVDTAGDVYVSDTKNKVIDEFANLPPKVLVSSPSNVTSMGAQANGTVNPHGQTITACRFEYGTATEVEHHTYKHQQNCTQTSIEGEVPVPVTAPLAGLAPNTIYDYRLAVESISGIAFSSDPENTGLLTSPTPFLFGAPAYASNVTQFAATLNGAIDPENTPVAYHFAYIQAANYNPAAASPYNAETGQIAPTPDLYIPANTIETQTLPQQITGLQAGTTYDFALVASSPTGTQTGPNQTFTTPPIPPPLPTTGPPTTITETTALLTGTINPQGWPTTYTFQYGTTTNYGSTWPTTPITLGALNTPQTINALIENLQPSTTYHYRLTATNQQTTQYGTDQTLTTPSYPPSTIQEPPTTTPTTTPPTKPKPKHKKTSNNKKKKHNSKKKKKKNH